jgi:undecaprenyl-diphosphatase
VFGSGLYQLYKVVSKEGITGPYGLPETALATVIAFIVGYVIIGWFLKYVSTRGYRLFVWYRILLGMSLFLLLGFNVISA